MNILFIGVPHSFHDRKWMAYLAKTNKVYSMTEISSKLFVDEDVKADLISKNIVLLDFLSNYSVSKPLRLGKSIQYLKQKIEELKIDIVHVLFASPYCIWLNHVKVPSIITTRGSDVLEIIPKLHLSSALNNKLLHSRIKSAFKKAAFVTSTSTSQLKPINDMFKVKSHLIRTGVDVDAIEHINVEEYDTNELRLKDKIIFFPRLILPIYNVQLQVDAIRLLPDQIKKSYTFVFIKSVFTENTDRHHLRADYQKEMISELKSILKDNLVVFHIGLTQKQMYAVYHKSSLTVMTPLSDGTPNSALEAMAAKCPLIIGNCEYDEDMFDNTCLRLMDYKPEKLRDLMVDALTDYPSELLENGYESVSKKGNLPTEMNKLIHLYEQALR